jgi:plasmid segregation protein ParM
MKKQSYSFPSVYEAIGTNLNFVSKDLINGLQMYDENEQAYIIGKLALTEGISPNKLVNSSPHDVDYQLFLKAGVLLANHNNNRPLAITTGFPFSTYQVYKDIAKQMIENLGTIEYNPGTYTNRERTKINANISQVEILPEMIGNIIALRVGEAQAEGNFFVVSLGFGTCEAVLSTENGIVHRTALSINGMQYAVDLFMRSLATKYYLGLKTEKQLDVSFRNDHIFLDRQKVNIVDLRKRILERYYKDIISTGLRRSFSDTDFERANKIFLTGGGALFPELVEQFENEFKQIATVEVVKNPLTLTSEGYSLNSVMLTGGDKSTAIGLDVGNANTVLTQYENESVFDTPEEKEEKIEVPKVEEKVEVKEEAKVEEEALIEEKNEVSETVVEVVEEEAEVKEEIKTEPETKVEEKIEVPETKEQVKVEEEENAADRILKKVEEKKEEIEEEVAETKETKPEKIIAEKVIDVVDEIVKNVSKPKEEEYEGLVIEEEKEEIVEEEVDEVDAYEKKLAELSEEEKEILYKEVNPAKGVKTEVEEEKIEKEDISGDKTSTKGSFDDYEPDFS